MWTCLGCKQFAGCTIDGQKAKHWIHVFVSSCRCRTSRTGSVGDVLPWIPRAIFRTVILKFSRPRRTLEASGTFRLHSFQAALRLRMAVQTNTPSRRVTKSKNTLHAEARVSTQTARSKLKTRCIGTADLPPHLPTGFTPLRRITASQLKTCLLIS